MTGRTENIFLLAQLLGKQQKLLQSEGRRIVNYLNRVLAKIIMDTVISMQLADDEQIAPDAVARITEPAARTLRDGLDNTSEEDRQAIIRLFREIAAEEGAPERRELASEFPEAMGLVPKD